MLFNLFNKKKEAKEVEQARKAEEALIKFNQLVKQFEEATDSYNATVEKVNMNK